MLPFSSIFSLSFLVQLRNTQAYQQLFMIIMQNELNGALLQSRTRAYLRQKRL